MGKHKGTLGTSANVVKRKQLKREKHMTDEELLEDAMREALKWKAKLNGNR
jgi:hypothetical protein